VGEGLVKEGGIFSSAYVTYKVTTDPLKWEVRRKDVEFYTLKKILMKMFPHIIIPPLPVKKNKTTPKFIKKRSKYYSRFLQLLQGQKNLNHALS